MNKRNIFLVLSIISLIMYITLTAKENLMLENNQTPTKYWIFNLSDLFVLMTVALILITALLDRKNKH